jgi:aspartate kinase
MMRLIVQKFGGTSVGTIERIEQACRRVMALFDQGVQVVVVLSAMAGETDRLLELAQQVSLQPDLRELDVLLSTGEQVTIGLFAMMLRAHGYRARSYTGGQVRIITDSAHGRARIAEIDQQRLRQAMEAGCIPIVAGFQGVDLEGNITTLGRGGSDTTAVALAAVLEAQECQIYTDVDGVYTTDPRIEPTARRLSRVTFEEMLELASLGAKVLQIRAVEFAGRYNVPLRVLSSFVEGPGTLITYEDEGLSMESMLVTGIAFNRNEAKIMLIGVPDQAGVAAQIVRPISDNNIVIDMIVQNNVQNGITNFTFTVNRSDLLEAKALIDQVALNVGAESVQVDNKIAKISIVGVGMRSHAGVAATMFKTFAQEGINIQLISTSEIKVSVVVDEKYLELGVRSLHTAFGLAQAPYEEQL